MNILQICPSHLSDVAILPWEIQKNHFSTFVFTHTHTRTHTHTHTHNLFNSPLSQTTRVSWYRKEKNLDFTEARDSEWHWHQLGHMQVCTSLQTDNHASTPPLSFFTGRMSFLPPNQQRQEHWRLHIIYNSSEENKQQLLYCSFSCLLTVVQCFLKSRDC